MGTETEVTIKYFTHLKIHKVVLFGLFHTVGKSIIFQNSAHTTGDFTAKLWFYYISEIPVARINQRKFNIIPETYSNRKSIYQLC